ncbi:E3 ubiquitin-protein ligase TRIM39-like isoform 2-T2 [Clarias gariepinus]|uniref:E3 ubiquitin-protein ligase TRIM39-like isoform X2 n=1 Tax=Clarias gariepinus TaxID=13013 RepID=UPI00234DCD6C|nr:E3 ubiquitin-protein ligase TRIM39-like isoform X2 [Clarias gariepinus]
MESERGDIERRLQRMEAEMQWQKQDMERKLRRMEAEMQKEVLYRGLLKQDKKYEAVKQYAVDVILDPDTAFPHLTLYPDGKQVNEVGEWKNLPDTPHRFSHNGYVLGKRGFSSGRFYFEVQVSGKSRWTLGIIRENVNRKGHIDLSPQKGVWAVRLWDETEYKACADPETPLTLKEKLEKIGVFVDYEEGLVSFYNAGSRSHIYSFTGQYFNEKKLYPLLCPWNNADNKNSTPLIITPVCKTE